MTKTGLDRISTAWPKALRGSRVGLCCHPASLNAQLNHASDILLAHQEMKVTSFFGPQHGIRGETQANMIEWEGFKDKKTGRMIYSLYGRHRKPTAEMLKRVDVLVLDLFDVGARYYTYIWTLYLCMEACAAANKTVVVLDRPNPINGLDVEGPVLDERFASFVGLKALPIRHGMTMGEITQYFKAHFVPTVKLEVVRMANWKRSMFYPETGLPFVNPSPNIPNFESMLLYPGMCLFEGTNISEGRGTTRPFEYFGAPFIDSEKVTTALSRLKLSGVHFRPHFFKPTFDKFKDEICGGAQIHISDASVVKPFFVGVAILKTIRDIYPTRFKWLKGPYEYEAKKKPIDILFGNDSIRKALETGNSLSQIRQSYQMEQELFKTVRKNFLLY